MSVRTPFPQSGLRHALQKPKRSGILSMPTVLRFGSMNFRIHLRNEHEPPHVHVFHPDGEVIVILDEVTGTARVRKYARTVRANDVTRIETIATEHFETLLDVWILYHRES
jgi:hypothetical protein